MLRESHDNRSTLSGKVDKNSFNYLRFYSTSFPKIKKRSIGVLSRAK